MKKFALSLSLILLSISAFSQSKMKPQDTEVWKPVPIKVTPGDFQAPPSDAIVLLGNDFSNWKNSRTGEEVNWSLENGIATVKPGGGGIETKQSFGSVQLHIEWRSPEIVEESEGQGRGNSGVFLQSQYEVQILDSYSSDTYSNGQAGSIYKQFIPLVNATRPPQEWQSYDIIFSAPEFDGDKVTKPAYITVIHNGVLIQNNVELKGKTVYIGYPEYKAHGKLPIQLQDHGNLVSFRNIWLRELD